MIMIMSASISLIRARLMATIPLVAASVAALASATPSARAAPAQKARPAKVAAKSESRYHNPLFGYTHLLPSPFTIPGGTLVFGTEVEYGLADFLQVGTNVIRDVYGFYNANARVSLIDYPEFALGAYVGWEGYSYKTFDDRLRDGWVTSWLPGASAGFAILPELAFFVGGNLRFSNADLSGLDTGKSGFSRGTAVFSELSWAYNPEGRTGGVGNVLSGGVSYDFTYQIYGVGLSHHWPGFHLGIHYYPNADRYRVQPILAGGGAIQF